MSRYVRRQTRLLRLYIHALEAFEAVTAPVQAPARCCALTTDRCRQAGYSL